ncbi:MAG: PilZ domain-containing protein [Singulisphaera sp.]
MPFASRPTPQGTDPADRRNDPRRTALEHRAWLGWTQERVFRTAAARLLDIGPAGALVETDAPLHVDEEILLALTNGLPDGGVMAAVVRITRGRRHRHRVHLAFTEPCPDSLLGGAIEGLPR